MYFISLKITKKNSKGFIVKKKVLRIIYFYFYKIIFYVVYYYNKNKFKIILKNSKNCKFQNSKKITIPKIPKFQKFQSLKMKLWNFGKIIYI